MRSRYSAYVLGLIDYLVATTLPAQQAGLDRQSISAWSAQSTWLASRESSEVFGGQPEHAFVTFTARWHDGQGEHSHRERSHSCRTPGAGTSSTRPLKLGRNDACPCASGQKFKKCCSVISAVDVNPGARLGFRSPTMLSRRRTLNTHPAVEPGPRRPPRFSDDASDPEVHLVKVEVVRAKLLNRNSSCIFASTTQRQRPDRARHGIPHSSGDMLLAEGEHEHWITVGPKSSAFYRIPIRTNLWPRVKDVVKMLKSPHQQVPYRLQGEMETGLFIAHYVHLARNGVIIPADLIPEYNR
jgi:uncharacterized protein YchJ